MRRTLCILCLAAAALAPASVRAEEDLAGKLPRGSIFFLKLDAKGIVEHVGKYLELLDPEQGGKFKYQVGVTREAMKEWSAAHEFKPLLFDQLEALKAFVVVMAKKAPEIKKHTYKVPKYNEETGEQIEGQFEEQVYEEKLEYTTSMIVESTEEVAEDFVTQFKALQERLKEKEPEKKNHEYKKVDVDQGELIQQAEGTSTLGRMGRHLIFSDANPAELWSALMAPPEGKLSESPLYQRFAQSESTGVCRAFLNTAELFKRHEAGLVADLDKATKAAAEAPPKQNAPSAEEDEEPVDAVQWEKARAEQELKAFRMLNKLFGLDKWNTLGGDVNFFCDGKVARTGGVLSMHFDEGLTPAMQAILTGGEAFVAPEVGDRDQMAWMFRIAPSGVLKAVQESMEPDDANMFTLQMGMMKGAVGYDLGEILAQLAGDVYLFLDVEKKDHPVTEYDMETEQFVTKTVNGPVPKFMVLFGLKDREAFAQMLSQTFTTISRNPMFAPLVKKRTYQETDVYQIGMDVSKPDADPDGTTSFALVAVGRYLSFGGWNDVTELIRRAKAAEQAAPGALAEVVAKNKDAQMLLVMSKAFIKKLQTMTQDGKDKEDELAAALEALEKLNLPMDDKELEEKLKTALKGLVESAKVLQDRAEKLGSPLFVVKGAMAGNYYEVKVKDELQKP
ncbi:MAG: hypothetical protein L6R28_10295 [Planctomycetes bacterium]|nr:hypothetical protein [Planctomycetota bacterium]